MSPRGRKRTMAPRSSDAFGLKWLFYQPPAPTTDPVSATIDNRSSSSPIPKVLEPKPPTPPETRISKHIRVPDSVVPGMIVSVDIKLETRPGGVTVSTQTPRSIPSTVTIHKEGLTRCRYCRSFGHDIDSCQTRVINNRRRKIGDWFPSPSAPKSGSPSQRPG